MGFQDDVEDAVASTTSSSSWPRMPSVSSDTYGERIALPSGATVTLSLSSSTPILNTFLNLTGADVTISTDGGFVTVPAAREALRVVYAPRQRLGVVVTETGRDTLARSLVESSTTATNVGATNVQVFAPRDAGDFERPLPPLGTPSGVLISEEAGACLMARGTPYSLVVLGDDDDDEDNQPKRTRRSFVPTYSVHEHMYLVRYRDGL